jgi:hypothetical protein
MSTAVSLEVAPSRLLSFFSIFVYCGVGYVTQALVLFLLFEISSEPTALRALFELFFGSLY